MLIKFAHKRHLVTYAFRNSYNIFLQTICTEYYCLQRATAPSNKLKMRYIFSGKMHPKQVNSKKNFFMRYVFSGKMHPKLVNSKKTQFFICRGFFTNTTGMQGLSVTFLCELWIFVHTELNDATVLSQVEEEGAL